MKAILRYEGDAQGIDLGDISVTETERYAYWLRKLPISAAGEGDCRTIDVLIDYDEGTIEFVWS